VFISACFFIINAQWSLMLGRGEHVNPVRIKALEKIISGMNECGIIGFILVQEASTFL